MNDKQSPLLANPLGVRVGAEFMLVVRNAATDIEVARSGWSHNLVTQLGIDRCLAGEGNARFAVRVGTGNAPPSLSDTDLQQWYATSTDGSSGRTTHQTLDEPFWAVQTWQFRFNAGVFDNVNISEVGLFEQLSPSSIYSRALVVDANGNPSTVTIQSDEYLDVYVRHYLVMGTSSGSFNQMILGEPETFNYELRPIRMTGTYEWGGNTGNVGPRLPKLALSPSGNNNNSSYTYTNSSLAGANAEHMNGTRGTGSSSQALREPYNSGDNVAKVRITYDLNNGNFDDGITGLVFNFSAFVIQMQLDKPIPKTNQQVYYIDLDVSMSNTQSPE